MSRTPSQDSVWSGGWRYLAAAMTEVLEKVIKKGSIDKGDIPEGILLAAQEFFHVALEELMDIPSDPLESIRNYRMAADALRRSMKKQFKKRESIDRHLQEYSQFLDSLSEERSLSTRDLTTAENLQRFFVALGLNKLA